MRHNAVGIEVTFDNVLLLGGFRPWLNMVYLNITKLREKKRLDIVFIHMGKRLMQRIRRLSPQSRAELAEDKSGAIEQSSRL